MFKNLENFKKVKEDEDSVHMMHPKGHVIIVATKVLPALQRKQLHALPLHECSGGSISAMASGGKVMKYADGTGDVANQDVPADVPPPVVTTPEEIDQELNQANALGEDADQHPVDVETGPEPHALPAPDEANPAPDEQPAPIAVQPAGPAPQENQPALQAGPQSMNVGDINQQMVSGIQGEAKAQQDLAKQQALIEQKYQKQQGDEAAIWDKKQKDMFDQIDSTIQDVKNGHIDPKHYVENMGAGQKIATAIGLFLGGLSTPFTHQGNPALEMLNKQIDRDIDAQKAGLNNKMNIYHAYLDQYHNAAAAEAMTRATQIGIYGSRLREAAANSGSAMAQARANQQLAQWGQQIYPLVQKANFLNETKQINDRAQGTGQLSALPPERLVQFTGAPLEDQNKMFDEIKNAQNINNIRQPSLAAFDQAAKDVRPMTGGIHTSPTAFIPGMESAGQKAFSGLANTTVKEVEGTARQAAFDSIAKNFRPNFDDDDATIKSKRARWQTYLKAQAAAPVANGYNLNLENYASTATRTPEIKIVNGVKYMRGPNGQAIPVK